MAVSKSKRESLFYGLFENTVDGIFLADDQFQVFNADDSFQKSLKYHPTDTNKVDFSGLFYNESKAEEVKAILKRKKRIQNHEVELKSRTGKRIYSELNILKSQEDSGEITYMGFFFNISKRKEAEKELLKVEKRLAAGKLSRILAHEVRNPLTNVQLALEQLKDEFGENAEEASLYFDVIKRNSERIGDLITALLNSSRPRTASLKSADLNKVTKEAIALVNDRLTLKNIHLDLDLKSNLPSILLDEEQIKIVLVNIMVNAIEAMQPNSGKLRITTKAQKKALVLLVEDNGLGMNDEEMEQLFEPFFSKKRKGTGLGLTTVQNIIHAHKGSITVKSKPEQGTRFTIKLPS